MKKIRNLVKKITAYLPVVYADIAPFRAIGVDLTPVEKYIPDIVMREENVDIYLYPDIAVIEATFWLKNDGEQTEISVGFPCFGRQSPRKPHDGGLIDFAAFADGKQVEIISRNLDNELYPAWYVWKQCFPEHAESCLNVRYHTMLFDYAHVSRIPFTYVLRTGRFWKGHIGKACITVHAIDIPLKSIQEATPPGFVMDCQQKTISWTFEDLYPEDDIGLLLSPTIIQGNYLGFNIDDVLDVNESRPPAKTEVIVGGYVRGQDGFDCSLYDLRDGRNEASADGLFAYIFSERSRDCNITIPDRIAMFDSENPLVSLPVAFEANFPIVEMNVPALLKGWTRYIIRGTVEYDAHARLYIHAQEAIMLRDAKLPYTSSWASDFPWVSGPLSSFAVYESDDFEYANFEKRTQTQWLKSSTQYERSKVYHKNRWDTP